MDVREKLVELLKSVLPNFRNNMAYWGEKPIYEFADCLLANGITVQEWISTTEMLPESGKEGVLIALLGGGVDIGWCEDGRWYNEFVNEYEDGEVTHWMPMPQPPKGE